MDRQRMECCLQQVAAYQASGQRSEQWALANGVKPRELASWCAHARRWQSKLDGVAFEPIVTRPQRNGAVGFIAAKLPANMPVSASASVRIELCAGGTRLELYWPLAHTGELAALLREVGR